MSITAVQARIAEIQARVTPAASGTAADFNAVMSAAVARNGETGATMTLQNSATASDVEWTPPPPGLSAPARTANGRVEPPAALRAYGNGKIPPSALTEIGIGNHRLYGPAAQSFKRLLNDAAAAGVKIGVTDSYRSYEQQVDLARRKGLYSQGGLAATPGTSNHGWGLSVDLDLDSRAQAWMRANGRSYGFVEDVPREPWHWTFHGATA